MDPLTLRVICISSGVIGLGLAGIITLAAINTKQKADLMILQLRLYNLKMMNAVNQIGKEKK